MLYAWKLILIIRTLKIFVHIYSCELTHIYTIIHIMYHVYSHIMYIVNVKIYQKQEIISIISL